MPAIQMVGPAYVTRSPAVAADKLINLFPEIREIPRPGSEVAALYSVPGTVIWTTLAAEIRGMLSTTDGRCFVVAGRTLYELLAPELAEGGMDAAALSTLVVSGLAEVRGTLVTQTGRVSMAENGLQVLIVDGANGYIFTLATNALAPITDDGFQGASHCAFVDGYFALNRPGTGQWYISALYDGLTYDATELVTAEAGPDPIVALLEFRRDIWTIGSRTTEVWFNQGSADFPFARIPGAVHQEGTIAPASVTRLGNEGLAWLGQNAEGYGIVWRTVGYQLQRISTHAIEWAIREAAHPEQATGWSYQREGHVFYLLTVGEQTWGYDVATGLWHERAVLTETGTLAPLPLTQHCDAFGHTLVGGPEGIVYRLSPDLYSWNGAPLPRIRQWQPVETGDRRRLFHHELEILMEVGVGLEGSGQGSDPQIMLQFSEDQGRTWSSERWKRIGGRGEYRVEVIWNQLGSSRERVYRAQVSDPVNVVFTGAQLRASGATT